MTATYLNCLCITLDPTNESRALRAKREAESLGLKCTFVEGVDVRKESLESLRRYLTVRSYYELKNGRYVHEALSSKGAIGCYLAHMKCWEACASSNTETVIVEDDFRCTDSAKNIFPQAYTDAKKLNYDILRLSVRHFPEVPDSVIQPVPGTCLYIPYFCMATTIYVITPICAKKFLEHCMPMETHVDFFVNFACDTLQLKHYCSENIFKDGEDIKSLIKHNHLKKYHNNMVFVYFAVGVVVGVVLLYLFQKRKKPVC